MDRTPWFRAQPRQGATILIVVAVALGLRLYAISANDLWGDEACMVYLCSESPAAIVSALSSEQRPDVDVAPPAYFLILHGWMKIFGASPGSVRGVSVGFDLLFLVSLLLFPQQLVSDRARRYALLLGVFSAFHVWYSQETRMYTMATVLATVSSALFFRMLVSGGNRLMMWYILATASLLYTQYYGVLVVGAQAAALLLGMIRRADTPHVYRARAALGLAVAALSFLPWMVVVVRDFRFAAGPAGFSSKFSAALTLPFLLAKFSLFGNETYIRENLWLYLVALPLFGIMSIMGIRRNLGSLTYLLELLLCLPILLVFGAALMGLPVYKSHPFIIFSGFYYLLLGRGADRLKTLGLLMLVIAVAANCYTLVSLNYNRDYAKPRVTDAIEYLVRHNEAGDKVYIVPAAIPSPLLTMGDFLVWDYYAKGTNLNITPVIAGSIDEFLADLAKSPDLGRISIVVQDNELLTAVRPRLFAELGKTYNLQSWQQFPSKLRGFKLDVVTYTRQ